MHDGTTFEQYAAENNISDDHPQFESIRQWWEAQDLVEKLWVSPLDPCPEWCVLEPGHKYESALYDEATVTETQEIGFHRVHQIATDAEAGSCNVTQEEFYKDGVVTLSAPVISVYGDTGCEDITAAEARRRAAALLNLADKLDEVTR